MRKFFSVYSDIDSNEGMVNLTPLIDVVFVVLILFILIAPLLELDRVQLASGSISSKKEMLPISENAPIKIQVFSDNTIWLNHHRVTEKELISELNKKMKVFPHSIPQLYHDKEASFGTYQMVKNAIETAGFQQLDLILKP